MRKLFILTVLALTNIQLFAQCSPDPAVVAAGDPEGDGVLNPWVLEVYPGQSVAQGVTVLAPPGGTGNVAGFNVPYTMNFFTVTSLDNKPSWLSYECPNNCKFLNGVYSCVQITGDVPTTVTPGDSVVVDVIVDANVDAVVLGFPYSGYEVKGENGGQLTIRYISAPASVDDLIANLDIKFNSMDKQLTIENMSSQGIVNVYNMQGVRISSSSDNVQNLHHLTSGMYVVEVLDGDQRKVEKIILR